MSETREPLTYRQTRDMLDTQRCLDCGVELDDGTAKVFTVCDDCWDKAYAPYKPSSDATGPQAPSSDAKQ